MQHFFFLIIFSDFVSTFLIYCTLREKSLTINFINFYCPASVLGKPMFSKRDSACIFCSVKNLNYYLFAVFGDNIQYYLLALFQWISAV
jgi:hypothetical protein